MKRFFGKRPLALAAIPLVLALLGLTLWTVTPRAAASATPTVTVTGYAGPGAYATIGGGNWPYGDPITITYDGTLLATTKVSLLRGVAGPAIGAFSVPAQIPPTATPGSAHSIIATDTQTNVTAQTTLTVMTEWTQYGYSAAETRHNPYETIIGPGNVANLMLAWTYQATGYQCTIPAFLMPSEAEGNLIFPDQKTCQLISLNAFTGAVNWVDLNYDPIDFTQPAISNGVIFGNANWLDANSTSTGALLWQTSYAGHDESPTVAGGMVYATGPGKLSIYYKALYAYNAAGCGQANCLPVWIYSPPGGAYVTPAVANGIVYYGSDLGAATPNGGLDNGSHVIALDAKTGMLQWYGSVADYQEISVTSVDNGYLVFTANAISGYPGSPTGTLYVFNASGCGQAACQPLWTASNPVGWNVSPAEANGMIYVTGRDGVLYAFNESGCGQATTCSPVWKSSNTPQTGTFVYTNPAVANGVVYFMNTSPGVAQAYDAAGCGPATTCSPLWSYTLGLGSSVDSNADPIIVNGMLYVSDNNGVLYAFHLPATVARSGASQTSPATPATPQRGASQPSRSPSRSPRYRAIWTARLSRYQGGWAVGLLL